MKRFIKSKILLIASLAVITAASVYVTGIYAYFTARDFAANDLKAGNSEVTVHEEFSNPDIEPEGETVITKRVTIENTGINYSAVRVKAVFSDESLLEAKGGPASVDYNTEDWTLLPDGYWYFSSPVAPGESTAQLFSGITFTNPGEKAKDFDVYIYAESRNCGADDRAEELRNLFKTE